MIIAELKSCCQIRASEMGILIEQRFHFGDIYEAFPASFRAEGV